MTTWSRSILVVHGTLDNMHTEGDVPAWQFLGATRPLSRRSGTLCRRSDSEQRGPGSDWSGPGSYWSGPARIAQTPVWGPADRVRIGLHVCSTRGWTATRTRILDPQAIESRWAKARWLRLYICTVGHGKGDATMHTTSSLRESFRRKGLCETLAVPWS